jgi:hypothetical protein
MGPFISLALFGSLKTSKSWAAREFPTLPNKYSAPPPRVTDLIKERRDEAFLVESVFFIMNSLSCK